MYKGTAITMERTLGMTSADWRQSIWSKLEEVDMEPIKSFVDLSWKFTAIAIPAPAQSTLFLILRQRSEPNRRGAGKSPNSWRAKPRDDEMDLYGYMLTPSSSQVVGNGFFVADANYSLVDMQEESRARHVPIRKVIAEKYNGWWDERYAEMFKMVTA